MNTNPIVDIVDFIAPYDDELFILHLGDNHDEEITARFKKVFNRSRNQLKIPKANYVSFSTSDVFRNKAKEYLDSEACIIILDSEFSLNIIQYITDKLKDELEGMLIDKFILQAPQDKFIFNVHSVDDDTLNALIKILDDRSSVFNYLLVADHLAIWVISPDEFNPLFS